MRSCFLLLCGEASAVLHAALTHKFSDFIVVNVDCVDRRCRLLCQGSLGRGRRSFLVGHRSFPQSLHGCADAVIGHKRQRLAVLQLA